MEFSCYLTEIAYVTRKTVQSHGVRQRCARVNVAQAARQAQRGKVSVRTTIRPSEATINEEQPMNALKYLVTHMPRLAALMSVVLASTLAASAVSADPPSRVGRVSYIQGSVSFYADRSEGWVRARINYPVTSQNSIWTEGTARAEVRIGASALRLADDTIVDFVRVLDDQTDTYLQRGTLNVRTRNYGNETYRNGFSVETTEGRYIVEGNGRYRIEAAQSGGESRLTVFAGRARFEGSDNNVLTVDAGKSLVVQNSRPALTFRFESAREGDFDRWADARDANWDATHTRYVRERVISPYMTGYEELDSHGEWIEDREYGRIWAPRYVSAGWAPYRYGSWTYVNPWGWTWVDDAPWGFAPFHYGRWVTVGSRWCWWPGRYHHRPVYAPALVAWYGSPGATLSVTVSNGRPVGWFPLAPHEHYVPRYTNNITHIRNVNYVTNNVTVINPPARYAHTNAATFVQPTAFVHSKPVAANLVRTDRAALANYVTQASINLPPPVRNAPALAGGRTVAPVYAAPQATGGAPQITTKPAMIAPGAGVPLQQQQPPAPSAPPAPAIAGAPMPAPVAPSQPGVAKPQVMPAAPVALGRPGLAPTPVPVNAISPAPAPQPAPVQVAPVAKPMPLPQPVPPSPAPTYTQQMPKPGSSLNHPAGPPPNPVTPPPNPVSPMPSVPPAIAGAPHRAPVLPPHMQLQPQLEPAPQPRPYQQRQPRVEPQRIEPARPMPQAMPQPMPQAIAPAAAQVHREVKPQQVEKPRHEGNREKPNEGRTKPGVVLQQ
jgi:hypothetical protein